jgi:hypothetical protein
MFIFCSIETPENDEGDDGKSPFSAQKAVLEAAACAACAPPSYVCPSSGRKKSKTVMAATRAAMANKEKQKER